MLGFGQGVVEETDFWDVKVVVAERMVVRLEVERSYESL